jgi:hypothetical protein
MIRDSAGTGVALVVGGVVLAGASASYLLWFSSPNTASAPVVSLISGTAYLGWIGRF